jgi:hypothetical protein
VSHLCLNSDYCIYSLVCIVGNMKRLASLAALTMLAAAGLGIARVSFAMHTHAQIEVYATKGGYSGVFALSLGGEAQVVNTPSTQPLSGRFNASGFN